MGPDRALETARWRGNLAAGLKTAVAQVDGLRATLLAEHARVGRKAATGCAAGALVGSGGAPGTLLVGTLRQGSLYPAEVFLVEVCLLDSWRRAPETRGALCEREVYL